MRVLSVSSTCRQSVCVWFCGAEERRCHMLHERCLSAALHAAWTAWGTHCTSLLVYNTSPPLGDTISLKKVKKDWMDGKSFVWCVVELKWRVLTNKRFCTCPRLSCPLKMTQKIQRRVCFARFNLCLATWWRANCSTTFLRTSGRWDPSLFCYDFLSSSQSEASVYTFNMNNT